LPECRRNIRMTAPAVAPIAIRIAISRNPCGKQREPRQHGSHETRAGQDIVRLNGEGRSRTDNIRVNGGHDGPEGL
jgi:hypothetical protein